MNEHGTELLDSFDRLSLNSLSKSSPSTFSLKPSRLLQPPLPSLPDKNSNNKPSNLSHVPCKFFKQGTCTAGANCIFSHNPDPTSESSVCKYFRKGNCKFGTKCALLHTMSPYTTGSTKSQQVQQQTTQQQSQQQQQQTNRLFAFESRFNGSIGQDRDYYLDPFASSAPSQSSFSLLLLSDERLRNQQQNNTSNDPLIQVMGTSPFQQQRPFLFNSIHNSNSSNSSNGNRIIQQPQQLHSIPESNSSTSSTSNYHHTLQYQQPYEDQEFFDDVNDFMLPSSLNDLLTPTELRKQQQFPGCLSSSSTSNSQQPSYEPMGTSSSLSSSWNVPFYNGNSHGPITNHGNYGYDDSLLEPQQPYFSNAINIPAGHGNASSSNSGGGNSSHGFSYQGYFSKSNTNISNIIAGTTTSAALTMDEEGPFIMEDTTAIVEPSSSSIKDIIKNNNTENYSFNHIIQSQNL